MDDLQEHLAEAFGDLRPETESQWKPNHRGLSVRSAWDLFKKALMRERRPQATPEQRQALWEFKVERRHDLLIARDKYAPVSRTCARCGKTFTLRRRRGQSRRKYCSAPCERNSPSSEAKQHPPEFLGGKPVP